MEIPSASHQVPLMIRTSISFAILNGSLQAITFTVQIDPALLPWINFLTGQQPDTKSDQQQLLCDPVCSSSNDSTDAINDSKDADSLCTTSSSSTSTSVEQPIQATWTTENAEINSLITEAIVGLELYSPELCAEGVNGTYFLKDKQGATIAIFKPNDEEGDTANNPKLRDGEAASPIRRSFLPGEAAQRELAAYLLDKRGFFGVPSTSLVKISSSFFGGDDTNGQTDGKYAVSTDKQQKEGSLQKFVVHTGNAGDIGAQVFPVHEVHKIGVLDIQILNNDRHEGNILYHKTDNGYKLIPIDHGYSLPHTLDGAWFSWMYWPQARQPFNAETLAYIDSIDIDEDSRTLRSLGVALDSVRNMQIATTLLKKASALQFCLFDIANMVCRKDEDSPSLLECWCQQASQQSLRGPTAYSNPDLTAEEEAHFLASLSQLMDEHLLQKSKARAS